MNTSKILLYAVVLWTLVDSRHAGRLRRSLDVEGERSNLTQKQEHVIHADVLQHFTSTPGPVDSGQETEDSRQDSTSSFLKDVPLIPEDIKVQRLKNDDHLHASYERRHTIDKTKSDTDSTEERNKTDKINKNDVISYKYNESRPFSSSRSELSLSHSLYEHVASSVAYVEDDRDEEEKERLKTSAHLLTSSTTEDLKVEQEWKNFDVKKKEKGKKEIIDSVTVPTDYNGAGRIEKPYKDNIISGKLKEKSKDSISEALDERRSTTIRISSSSVSDSVNEHDHSKPLSLGSVKVGSSGANDEESVNQRVNSVISGNGVNSDSGKKSRVKYSVKRVNDNANDTEAENSSASVNQLTGDAVPALPSEPQTNPSLVQIRTTESEKLVNSPPKYSTFRNIQLPESTTLKGDIKPSTSSSTTLVKPSIAFKQQLVNKKKILDPAPTVPLNIDIPGDEGSDKNGKTSTKSGLRKKPKVDYYAGSSEMYIPPTATAWTLVSLKSTADGPKGPQKPVLPEPTPTPSEILATTVRQTTITPVSRVKSFVPWSTRLQKNTSLRTPTTKSVEDVSSTENVAVHSDSEISSTLSNEMMNRKPGPSKLNSHIVNTATEQQTVIRTTEELERNITETSVNLVQPSLNDVMVKDQSSSTPQEVPKVMERATTEGVITSTTMKENVTFLNFPENRSESVVAEKDNIIDTKILEENDTKTEEKPIQEEIEEKSIPNSVHNKSTSIQEASLDISENANEVKPGNANQSFNVLTSASPVTVQPEPAESNKIKNISEIAEMDLHGDILDGADDGKSGEESEEYEKPKTTTVPPETTMMPDLDDDVDGESSREEEDLPMIIDKLPTQNTSKPAISNSSSSTNEVVLTTSTSPKPITTNISGTYVTSFDIVSRENTTEEVIKAPAEVDKNWYNVDIKPEHVPEAETTLKTLTTTTVAVDTTTLVEMETTIEPETTTEINKEETTVVPELESATTASPTTTVPTTKPTITLEEDTIFESVDDPTSCVRIVVHVSPLKLCQGQQELRESIASQLMTEGVTYEQVQILSKRLDECGSKQQSTKDQLLNVDVCFVDKNQEPSPSLRDEFLKLNSKRDLSYPSWFQIVEVQMIVQPTTMTEGFDNVLAAIVLSVIAAICLVLLGILLVIIRKRQGRFNYGQRCTPVSLDDYSLDNISVYNSVRRKGALRASKRSYGNPAFDDPSGPTHAINFAGLANFSSDREALDEEFNQIPMITVKPDELPPGAEAKNRYANVIPLPETRVVLQTKDSSNPLDEYINANYIKGPKGQEKLYIACQAPLQSTVEDFWRMVWQQQTKVILMLTALTENGVDKCADYLPQLEITDCHRLFGDFQVTLKKHEVREKYIISSLQLKNLESNLWREVTHLWYSSWPAQGVPEDGSAMIAFLIEARSYMRGAQGPTVVHCSPGTGRTGTVIAIDLCIRDFETLRTVDIPKTVYALRRDRAGAVQTKDQYAFIYQVLNLYATKLTGGALDSI